MIQHILTYDFLQRALIVGILVSVCSSLLGVTLVLKKYSMIGDGLSHVGFGALAIAAAFNFTPLYIAIPSVIIAAFVLLRFNGNSVLKGDSAIALIASSSLAIGVICVSINTGLNADINNYMFGSILSLNNNDVALTILLSVMIIFVYVFMYNKIFAVTFDETFARATGINVGGYNSLIAVLTSITIVLGMRLMGTLLISSLIVFPSLTSMKVFKTYKSVIISSVGVSVLCFISGLCISTEYGTPTGATIVVMNLIAFIIGSTISTIRNI